MKTVKRSTKLAASLVLVAGAGLAAAPAASASPLFVSPPPTYCKPSLDMYIHWGGNAEGFYMDGRPVCDMI